MKNQLINKTTICHEVDRAHIAITLKCNNNCLFCLQGHRPDEKHRLFSDIKYEIDSAKNSGVSKIVLSGGEPTIHQDYLKIVKYCSDIGIKKIQTISNGRMFSNFKFLKKAISFGLTEVTLSIHGANAKTHDYLVNVPGAFKQIEKTIENLKNFKVVVSIDTGIFEQNYKELPEIISLIYDKYKIRGDIDLIGPTYQGNAVLNSVMPKYSDVEPYLKKALQMCKDRKVVCWVLRVPLKYMEGYELHRQDADKLVEKGLSISANIKSFPAYCFGKKCEYCYFRYVCAQLNNIYPFIFENKKTISKLNILIDNLTVGEVSDRIKYLNFSNYVFLKGKNQKEIVNFLLNSSNSNKTEKIILNDCFEYVKDSKLIFNYNYVSDDNKTSTLFNIDNTLFLENLDTVKTIKNKKLTIILTKKNIFILDKIVFKFYLLGFRNFEFKNFNPFDFVKRKVSWDDGMDIFDTYDLVPNYSDYETNINSILNNELYLDCNFYFSEIPLCVFSEESQKKYSSLFNIDLFISQISLKSINIEGTFNLNEYLQKTYKDTYKERIKKCDDCKFKYKCTGFFEMYLKLKNY